MIGANRDQVAMAGRLGEAVVVWPAASAEGGAEQEEREGAEGEEALTVRGCWELVGAGGVAVAVGTGEALGAETGGGGRPTAAEGRGLAQLTKEGAEGRLAGREGLGGAGTAAFGRLAKLRPEPGRSSPSSRHKGPARHP